MLDTVTPVTQPFPVQLKTLLDLEGRYQPKLSGLRLIDGAQDNGLRMTTRLRELEVKDLLSLSRFFGFCSETFSLAVSLLDRFLSVMKVCKTCHIKSLKILFVCYLYWWRHPSRFPTDSTQAPVLRRPVLLLHRRESLGGGEERAAGQRPDPHQSEPLHGVGHDPDGEDHHGEAPLEGEGPDSSALPSPVSRSRPGAARRREVRINDDSAKSCCYKCLLVYFF